MFVLAHGQSVQPFLAQTRTTFLGESQGDLSRRKPGQVSVKKMVFFHIQRANITALHVYFQKKTAGEPAANLIFYTQKLHFEKANVQST